MKLFKVFMVLGAIIIIVIVGLLFFRPKPVEWVVTENNFAPDFVLKKYLPRDSASLEGKAELYYKGVLVKYGLANYNDSVSPRLFKETDKQIFVIVNFSDLKDVMQVFGYINKKDDSWHDLPLRDGLLDIQGAYFIFTRQTSDYVKDEVNSRIIMDIAGFDAKIFNYGSKETCLLPLKYNNWYLVDARFVPQKENYVVIVTDDVNEPTQNVVLLGSIGCQYSDLKKIIPKEGTNYQVDHWEDSKLILADYQGTKETVLIK